MEIDDKEKRPDDTIKDQTVDKLALKFEVTENISKIGITEIVLERSLMVFTIGDRVKCFVPYLPNKTTISKFVKDISKKLFKKIEATIDDPKVFDLGIFDIESQIIKHRNEIFNISSGNHNLENTNHVFNDSKTKFAEDVIALRNQYKESTITYEEWQTKVYEKYENLRKLIRKYYPEAWIFMEFCLSVKSIINILDFTLPFMGVLVAAPSSMKTMIIQLFRKYPNSFYTDSFTPSSLVSHNSSLTEEQLQKVDMLPKMKDRLVLTPELAPIITAKDDDLQKVLGIITRLLDGHGLENDSGAHGHRKYGDTMFVWLGAAVEIPPRVWKLLGTLGHKIYFLRPSLRKKTTADLKKIAKSNNFSSINKEIEGALLDYLKTFDAVPEMDGKAKIENGIVKVTWNDETEGDQEKSIGHLAQLANLLASLRGIVYVSESKFSNRKNYNSTPNQHQQQQVEGPDYDTDFPIIEDASRAVILLRNIAIGHAVSQGRNCINLEDIPITIKVALSTAPIRRVKVLDLLLKSDTGELTTSQITSQLSISQPIATRTMREFSSLGLAEISSVSNYENSELKIKLNSEFEWFRSKEFLDLKEDFVPSDEDKDNANDNKENVSALFPIKDDLVAINDEEQQDNIGFDIGSCDNEVCHTLKGNQPPEAHKKNNQSISCINSSQTEQEIELQQSKESDNLLYHKEDIQNDSLYKNSNQDTTNNPCINIDQSFGEKNDGPLWDPKSFERVTSSQEKNAYNHSQNDLTVNQGQYTTLKEIINTIKLSNGSSITLSSVIESIHGNSEVVRNYLGDKVTSRENRRVRDLLLEIIRHPNVEVIKYKPQLLVRWSDNMDSSSCSYNGGLAQ